MLNNSAFPGEAAVKRKVDKKISNSKVIAIKGSSAIFPPNVIIVTKKIFFNTMFAVVKRKFIKIIKLNFKSVWIENRKGVIIKLVRLRKLR